MKKLSIITIVIIGLITNLFGFDFEEIKVTTRLGFGYFISKYKTIAETSLISSNGNIYENKAFVNYGTYKTTIGVDINYQNLTLYFTNYAYMDLLVENKSFAPNIMEFYSGLKYKLTSSLSIKAEHLCIHPIGSYEIFTKTKIYGTYNFVELTWNY